jgi:glycosyltransferase involved in cell wall biosynthesis
MRIGIDATALYGRYGGVEYALWNLLVALHAEDAHNEYHLYIPCDGPPRARLGNFNARWHWHRLPFRGTQKLRRILWQQTTLPAQLRRDGCDILHAPTYIAPWSTPVPTVLTVYDLIALTHPEFATAPNRLHYGALLPRSIKNAARVIAPTRAVADEIETRFPTARTSVVPLGLEPIFFAPPRTPDLERVRARYCLPEEYLLFVGNFEPKKNLPALLSALALLPNAPPLVIAGGNRAWRGHEAADVCDESTPGSTPKIKTIGYVSRADLPALYAGCEAFIFPSLAEGFGLPVLEALACGASVVTSTKVPLPDLKQVALICDPQNAAEIAASLKLILQNAPEAARLKSAGQEYARAFTWRRAARETLAIYRELI